MFFFWKSLLYFFGKIIVVPACRNFLWKKSPLFSTGKISINPLSVRITCIHYVVCTQWHYSEHAFDKEALKSAGNEELLFRVNLPRMINTLSHQKLNENWTIFHHETRSNKWIQFKCEQIASRTVYPKFHVLISTCMEECIVLVQTCKLKIY